MAKFSKAHRLALSKAAKARYGKKRGVKPGTKRGPYRKARSRKARTVNAGFKAGDLADLIIPKSYAPNPVLTLCGQLEDSILLLEQRISNAITKINSLMG